MSQVLRSLWSRWLPRPAARPVTRHGFRPQLEGLETRTLPAVALPTGGAFGPALVSATTTNNQFVLRMQAFNTNFLQISDNGGASFTTVAVSAISGVTITGFGNDTLTLDNTNGVVGKVGDLNITYNGGPGHDTIVLTGNPNTLVNNGYAVGDTIDAGVLAGTAMTGGSYRLNFTGVAAIRDTMNAANFNVSLNDNANFATLTKGLAVGSLSTMKLAGIDYQNNAGAVDDVFGAPAPNPATPATLSFVPITFANKTNVTINGRGGDDLLLLSDAAPVTGLASLLIDGGLGADRVLAGAAPPGTLVQYSTLEQLINNATDAVFIEQLYSQRLNRLANDAEIAMWSSLLHSSGGPTAVTQGIEESGEARARLVTGWFSFYLYRAPNATEVDTIVNQLQQGGLTEEAELSAILSSPEYLTISSQRFSTGTADQRYVSALYLDLLGRSITNGEMTSWLKAKPVANATQVALSFLTGTEVRGRLLDGLYTTYLGRTVDSGAFKAWVNSGLNFTQLREGLQSSLEFYDVRKAGAPRLTFPPSLATLVQGQTLSTTDAQFYSLNFGKLQILNLSVGTIAGVTALVQLEDQVGNVLAATQPGSGINTLRASLQPNQTYYLRVVSSANLAANFALNLTLLK